MAIDKDFVFFGTWLVVMLILVNEFDGRVESDRHLDVGGNLLVFTKLLFVE